MENQSNNPRDIRQSIDEAKKMIAELNTQVAQQEARLNSTHQEPLKPISSPLPPPPPPAPAPATSAPTPNYTTFTAPAPTNQTMGMEKKSSFEEKLAGKWFTWIGGFALFIGMTLLVKYAYDNEWIGPRTVIWAGIILGVALIGWGIATIKKYSTYGQIISGLGVGILYLSIYSAYGYYELISSVAAFIFMVLVTGVGLFLSVYHNSALLLVVSILGGFLTPIMVSTGENKQLELLSYITILDLAILGISFFRKWIWANLVGFLGTFFVFYGWSLDYYSADQLAPTMIFLTIFFLIYSLSSVAYLLVKREKSSGVEQLLTILSAVIYFVASYSILDSQYHDFLGLFSIFLALYYFIWTYGIRTLLPEDQNLYNFLAALGTGFVFLAIPIQFDGLTVTIGWTILSVILLLLGMRVQRQSILFFGLAIFLLAIIKIICFDFWEYGETGVFLWNKIFATLAFMIALAYGLSFAIPQILKEQAVGVFKKDSLSNFFLAAGNFLLTACFTREILKYHEEQSAIWLSIFWMSEALIFVAWGLLQKKYAPLFSGIIAFGLAGLALLGVYSIQLDNRLLFLNQAFFAFLFAALVAYAIAFMFRYLLTEEGLGNIKRTSWTALFLCLANIITIFGINQEISTGYQERIDQLGSVKSRLEIQKLENQNSTVHSLFWILYGIILLVFGIVRKAKLARWGGLGLLLFAILKLFFYDLWDLGRLYQIISSITLGFVLIGTSWVYLKFKDKIREAL